MAGRDPARHAVRSRAHCWRFCRAWRRSGARPSGCGERLGDAAIDDRRVAWRPRWPRASAGHPPSGAPDGARSCSPRRSRRPRSPSRACASSSTAGSSACPVTSRTPASPGSRPCACRGRPPTSGGAAPDAPSRASPIGSGTSRETAGLLPFTAPEIHAADLARLLLDCAAWGVTDPRQLAWLDPPPAGALAGRARGTGDARRHRCQRRSDRRRTHCCVRCRCRRGWRAWCWRRCQRDAAGAAAEIAAVLVERGLGGTSPDLDERLEAFRRDRSPAQREYAPVGQGLGANCPNRSRDGPRTVLASRSAGRRCRQDLDRCPAGARLSRPHRAGPRRQRRVPAGQRPRRACSIPRMRCRARNSSWSRISPARRPRRGSCWPPDWREPSWKTLPADRIEIDEETHLRCRRDGRAGPIACVGSAPSCWKASRVPCRRRHVSAP